MSKVIVFDLLSAQPLGNTKFHGGGEYTKSVFSALANSEEINKQHVVICYSFRKFIDPWIKDLIVSKQFEEIDTNSIDEIYKFLYANGSTWNEIRFYTGMCYGYTQPFPSNVVSIGTCHGLREIEKPIDSTIIHYINSFGKLKRLILSYLLKPYFEKKVIKNYTENIKYFKTIVAVSEHTKTALAVCFPNIVHDKNIVRFYTPEKKSDKVEIPEQDERYIMMVSANRWLKNAYRGVLAIDELYTKGLLKGIKTKVFGDLPFSIRKRLKNIEAFEFLGYVETNELESAYAGCDLFFYPTLNEGFGLPPMEAMKYGKTCVISGIASLPEVYKSSVYYCNPYDILEMQNRILFAINNKINHDIISNRINEITSAQRDDLDSLINLILHE